MQAQTLIDTALSLVVPGKGLLAADESQPTIEKRFSAVNVPSTEDTRRDYREMLFSAPGVEEFISGAILFEETLFQKSHDGKPLAQLLAARGIIPGIKVDKGAKPLALADGEKVTEGLDGLRDRLSEFKQAGARFAKWRAVINVDDAKLPSEYCIAANAHALARYAALCQEADIVPIVEPEVLMDGAHSLERCAEVTDHVLKRVFAALGQQRVLLEGILLKPNMVIPGKQNARQASAEEVADATVRCFLRNVPAAVPGVVFLSGGQSDEDATAHLNAMNARHSHLPWALSFSYGRALQAPALSAWAGRAQNVEAAQRIFLHRARCNGAAAKGAYNAAMEKAA